KKTSIAEAGIGGDVTELPRRRDSLASRQGERHCRHHCDELLPRANRCQDGRTGRREIFPAIIFGALQAAALGLEPFVPKGPALEGGNLLEIGIRRDSYQFGHGTVSCTIAPSMTAG